MTLLKKWMIGTAATLSVSVAFLQSENAFAKEDYPSNDESHEKKLENKDDAPVSNDQVEATKDIQSKKENAEDDTKVYTVKAGDTLVSIGQHLHQDWKELAKRNAIKDPSLIHVGDTLTYKAPAPSVKTYVVHAGDTLSKIASVHQTTLEHLIQENTWIKDPNLIHVGDTLTFTDGIATPDEYKNGVAGYSLTPEEEKALEHFNGRSGYSQGTGQTEAVHGSQQVVGQVATQSYDPAHAGSIGTPITSSARQACPGNTAVPGQCTWYAFNRMYEIGKPIANGRLFGNAWQWADSARSYGIPTSGRAKAGTVACFPPGVAGASGYGHVAIVEAVNGDGSLTLSEMNYNGMTGVVSQRTLPAGSYGGTTFIG